MSIRLSSLTNNINRKFSPPVLWLLAFIVVFNIYAEYVNLFHLAPGSGGGNGDVSATTTTTSTSSSTYTVPMLTTQVAYPHNQSYEMLLDELPTNFPSRDEDSGSYHQDMVVVENFTWDQLKKEVAFIVLITTCEGVYPHLALANNYVTVFFVSAINDNIESQPCHHAIPPGHHIVVNQTVGYQNNGLKVMEGYKAVKKAANFNIIFKMDSDCVLNLPTLHKVLNYMASQPTKSYFVGEMMMNNKFMSGMLYGISDYEQQLPDETPLLAPFEDTAFGKWMNSMHDGDDTTDDDSSSHNESKNQTTNAFVMTRLNLAPWYYGKNKRELKYGCYQKNWLVVHNSAWESHRTELHEDYDCDKLFHDENYQFNGTLKDYVSIVTRSDHRKQYIKRMRS